VNPAPRSEERRASPSGRIDREREASGWNHSAERPRPRKCSDSTIMMRNTRSAHGYLQAAFFGVRSQNQPFVRNKRPATCGTVTSDIRIRKPKSRCATSPPNYSPSASHRSPDMPCCLGMAPHIQSRPCQSTWIAGAHRALTSDRQFVHSQTTPDDSVTMRSCSGTGYPWPKQRTRADNRYFRWAEVTARKHFATQIASQVSRQNGLDHHVFADDAGCRRVSHCRRLADSLMSGNASRERAPIDRSSSSACPPHADEICTR